jgi:hypothetical protein
MQGMVETINRNSLEEQRELNEAIRRLPNK